MNSPEPCTLGIDLGGTHARAAVVTADGRLRSSGKMTLVERSPGAVIDAIYQAATRALEGSGEARVSGCGVGVAGQLDGESGRVVVAPNLGWRDVPFGSLLGEKLGRPVRVVNDLSAAAWGELSAGAARGDREVLVVFVGSGVGSAFIDKGALVRGARGVAGELGHIKVIAEGGRLCGCGENGCLEAYAGGHNLIAQMREALAADSHGALHALVGGDEGKLNPAVLEQAAEAGDPTARSIYDAAVGYLGLAIANQVTVFNPSHVILGGGVLMNCPGMQRRVIDIVQNRTAMVARKGLRVSPASLGDDSGLIGAALLATASL